MTEIDFDDLASSTDLAVLFKVSPTAISNWKQREDDFPDPVVTVSQGNNPLYSRREVVRWYAKRLSPELIEMIKEL